MTMRPSKLAIVSLLSLADICTWTRIGYALLDKVRILSFDGLQFSEDLQHFKNKPLKVNVITSTVCITWLKFIHVQTEVKLTAVLFWNAESFERCLKNFSRVRATLAWKVRVQYRLFSCSSFKCWSWKLFSGKQFLTANFNSLRRGLSGMYWNP